MITIKDEWLQRDMEAFFKARADITAGIVTLTPEALSGALLAFVMALRESKEKLGDTRFRLLLAEYAATLREPRQAAGALDGPRSNGIDVRAAVRAGVITDLEEDAVGDLSPLEARDLARQIDTIIGKAYEVPGE